MWTIPASKTASIVQREIAIEALVRNFVEEPELRDPQPIVAKEPEIDLTDLSFEDGVYVWFVR